MVNLICKRAKWRLIKTCVIYNFIMTKGRGYSFILLTRLI